MKGQWTALTCNARVNDVNLLRQTRVPEMHYKKAHIPYDLYKRRQHGRNITSLPKLEMKLNKAKKKEYRRPGRKLKRNDSHVENGCSGSPSPCCPFIFTDMSVSLIIV